MAVLNPDPSLPSNPAPIFADTNAARGDEMRANNNKIWGNFTDLDTRVDDRWVRTIYGDNLRGTILSSDLNAITKSGFYSCYGAATGAPSTASSWLIIHQNSSVGNASAYQRAVAFDTTLRVYERMKISSSWGAWVETPDRDNAPIVGSTIREELTYVAASASWRWWCMNQANTTINAANFAPLAAAMRAHKIIFRPESTNKSTFDATAWLTNGELTATLTLKKNANLSGNVNVPGTNTATFDADQSLSVGTVLIFSTGALAHVTGVTSTKIYTLDIAITVAAGQARIATYEELLTRALNYANEAHGSFTDWFCLTLSSAIGNIPAGDYPIVGLSVTDNTITISSNAVGGSGTGTYTGLIAIYPYRIPLSSNARHYSIAEHNLVAAGGSECACVAGIMRLSYMQGHEHRMLNVQLNNGVSSGISGATLNGTSWGSGLNPLTAEIYNDGINGASRAGKTTHGADLGAYFYLFAGTVTA